MLCVFSRSSFHSAGQDRGDRKKEKTLTAIAFFVVVLLFVEGLVAIGAEEALELEAGGGMETLTADTTFRLPPPLAVFRLAFRPAGSARRREAPDVLLPLLTSPREDR